MLLYVLLTYNNNLFFVDCTRTMNQHQMNRIESNGKLTNCLVVVCDAEIEFV